MDELRHQKKELEKQVKKLTEIEKGFENIKRKRITDERDCC